MTTTGQRLMGWAIVVLVLAHSTGAVAQVEGAGNLLGHRGMLRMASASNHPAGWIGLGTDFQYFKIGDFLLKGEDHARMVNSYSIVWAPFDFIEGAMALHVTSDKSMGGADERLMVAVGDPEFSVKGGAKLDHGFSLGGLLDLRFPSGAGFFEPSPSAVSLLISVLGSWSISPRIPLAAHVNLGFLYDGSKNLFDDITQLEQDQLYAAQVSSFSRLVARLGLEYVTRYVGPFLELSLEPYLGDEAPGFGSSPGLLSIGARAWPTRQKGLQLLAALDIGITGVGDGTPLVDATSGKHAYGVPSWNLVFRLSYRFDAFSRPKESSASKEADTPSPEVREKQVGAIHGVVVDEQTSKPVWNARISLEGEDVSHLAVDPKDGTFRTYQIPAGPRTLVATADGYNPAEMRVQVDPGMPASANFRLAPKASLAPGTMRGTVKALVGQNPESSTILIPALDRTITIGADGTFSVSLKPGEYKVVVSAKGFRTQTKTIHVREGSTVILNVELHR